MEIEQQHARIEFRQHLEEQVTRAERADDQVRTDGEQAVQRRADRVIVIHDIDAFGHQAPCSVVGSVNRKTAPPSGRFSALRTPPWASMIRLLMESPIPIPLLPCFVVVKREKS